jgi:hypothetical protein
MQAASSHADRGLHACSQTCGCPLYAQIAIFIQFFGSAITLEKICDINAMALTLFNLVSVIYLINLSTYPASIA